MSSVVYLGRIPHGFYEDEMRAYFTQFGKVVRLRLSRNKKTGHSKHYAFVEFEDSQVAKIVAETMDGYLLFNHVLKCSVVPIDEIHSDLFKGSDKKFKAIPWNKIQREKQDAPKTAEQTQKNLDRLLAKEAKKRLQFEALGIDFDFAGYAKASITSTVPVEAVSVSVPIEPVAKPVETIIEESIEKDRVEVVELPAKRAKRAVKSVKPVNQVIETRQQTKAKGTTKGAKGTKGVSKKTSK